MIICGIYFFFNHRFKKHIYSQVDSFNLVEARISKAFIKVNLIFLVPKLDLFTEEGWKCKKIRGERIPASKLV